MRTYLPEYIGYSKWFELRGDSHTCYISFVGVGCSSAEVREMLNEKSTGFINKTKILYRVMFD